MNYAAGYAGSVQRPPRTRSALARAINGLLFLALAVSAVVFVEPAPYEAFFALLTVVCLLSSLRLDGKVAPLIALLLIWNVSGLVALLPVMHDFKAVTFMVTSFYLALTAVLFAFLVADDPRRLNIIRTGYIFAAVGAALYGLAVYLHILPGFEETGGRIQSTFKDPNVFGPFLILPILFLIDRLLRVGFSLRVAVPMFILMAALFLSFSRGAWGHFLFSTTLMLVLMFLTSESANFRVRLIGYSVIAIAGAVMLLALLLSFDAVGAMFMERANLLNEYDAGQGGRFGRQLEGLGPLLEAPFGFGPMQFAKLLGQDPHNVYINAFASYGWIGGITYVTMVLATLVFAFRAVFVRTPWQPYLILALSTFTGTVLEGFIIDTDHWRHYYLMLGIIWGMIVLTARWRAA